MTNSVPRYEHVLVMFLLSWAVWQTQPAVADEGSELTLGAYQTYRTPDSLWLLVDIDQHILDRPAYSEPPVLQELVCVRVFRIAQNGAVRTWMLSGTSAVSASYHFSYLVSLRDDVFLIRTRVSLLDPDGLGRPECLRFTVKSKPLAVPIPISSKELFGGLQLDPWSLKDHTTLRIRSNRELFFLDREGIYDMENVPPNLPKEMADLEVRFREARDGHLRLGSRAAIVHFVGRGRHWSKTVIDLDKAKAPCDCNRKTDGTSRLE